MASHLKSLSEYDANRIPDVAHQSFGIVVSDYNPDITYALLKACIECLLKHGCKESNIIVKHVPGAFELPLGAELLFQDQKLDAVICLGCIIKGGTRHDEYINHAIAQAIMKLNSKYKHPFIFGVLTPNTLAQAQDRAGGKHGNKGIEAAIAAIKMVHFK